MKRPIEVYFIAVWSFLQTPFYISTPIGVLGKLLNFSTDFTPKGRKSNDGGFVLAGAPSAAWHCDCQPESQSWFECNSPRRIAPQGLDLYEA